MNEIQRWTTSARLAIKVNRFEFVCAVVVAVGVAIATIVATQLFVQLGDNRSCLEAWVTSVPTDAACESFALSWGSLNEGFAGKVMAAMAFLPLVVGLLIGSPLVAREIESGTAPLAWAVSGSRVTWLIRQVGPMTILIGATLAIVAIPSSWLADVRSAGGVWSSTFADADLSGLPVVARGILAFSIGLACGSVIGRTLPSFLVSVAGAILVAVALSFIQASVVRTTHDLTNVGSPGSAAALIRDEPAFEIRIIAQDNEILTLEQALSRVPVGEADPVDWVAENNRIVTLGVKNSITFGWQLLETGLAALLSAGLIGCAAFVVARRSPR